MILDSRLEILDGLPMLYIRDISAIACSDLHLGYERMMAGRGIFAPKKNLEFIKEIIKKAVGQTGASHLIVTGDVKNEFSRVQDDEFNELKEFVLYAKSEIGLSRVSVIKGNHDTFVKRLLPGIDVDIIDEEFIAGGILFMHGDCAPRSSEWKTLVMGHLHPTLAIFNKMGTKEKLKCFLYGNARDGRRVVVMPAMNYFASGADVNSSFAPVSSPVFEGLADMGSMHAICISDGESLDFGTVRDLRRFA